MKICLVVKRWTGSVASAVLLFTFPGLADAQYSAEREPLGPSSRKTGLAITEIMYHPRPVPGLTNRLQYLELYNSKPWDEDISGFSIDGLVHYVLPSNTVLRANAFLVLARDPE